MWNYKATGVLQQPSFKHTSYYSHHHKAEAISSLKTGSSLFVPQLVLDCYYTSQVVASNLAIAT